MPSYTVDANGQLISSEEVTNVSPAPAPDNDTSVVVVRGFLDEDEIQAIFKDITGLKFNPAKLSTPEGGGQVRDDFRKSMVAFLPPTSMPGLQLAGAVKAISGGAVHQWDKVQVALYEPGMFFERHKDAGTNHGYRLWTSVVELQSAPGGGLEVDGCGPLDMEPGDLVVFPASTYHRATAPTEGARFSLTNWFWT